MMFGWNFEFWNLIKICVRTCYFGKQNSTLGSVVPLAMFCDYFPLILDAYVMGVYSTKLPLFWIANPSHVEAGNSDKSWKISGLTHSQVAPCFTSQHLSPLSSVLEFWLKTSQENITWFKNLFFLCPFQKPCWRLSESLMFSRFQDYRVLESIAECCRVLQSITEYYRVLQSITECYRVLQSVTEYYRVLQSVREYYRVLQSIIEFYRVFLAHLLGPVFGLVLFTKGTFFHFRKCFYE